MEDETPGKLFIIMSRIPKTNMADETSGKLFIIMSQIQTIMLVKQMKQFILCH